MPQRLGELLIAVGVVKRADVEAALAAQSAGQPERIGELLVAMGRLTPRTLAQALARQSGLPFVDLAPVPREIADIVPLDVQVQHCLVPFQVDHSGKFPVLHLAMADPSALSVLEDLSMQLGLAVKVHVASSDQIEALHAAYQGSIDPVFSAPPQSPVVPTAPIPPLQAPAAEPARPPPAVKPVAGRAPVSPQRPPSAPKVIVPPPPPVPSPAGKVAAKRPANDKVRVATRASPAAAPAAAPRPAPSPGPAANGDPLSALARPAWLEEDGEPSGAAERALSSKLEMLVSARAGESAPEVIAAVVRLLVKRGLLNEAELLEELGPK